MEINRNTYEEMFLLYIDGELSEEDRKAVEHFMRQNPDLEEEFVLMQETVFTADDNLVFENKGILYKNESNPRVLLMPWFRMAAAAVVLITLGLSVWIYLATNAPLDHEAVASVDPVDNKLNDITPVQPSVSIIRESTPTPAEQLDKPYAFTGNHNQTVFGPVSERKNRRPEAKVTPAIQPSTLKSSGEENQDNLEELKDYEQDIVSIPSKKEAIDFMVQGRAIGQEEPPVAPMESETEVRYGEPNNDIIYVANTSLPKSKKLRGVFRKASRFLDKVTSLQ